MTQQITTVEQGTGRLGPAMQALNERQRKFVGAMLQTGRYNNTLHARMAGYTGDDTTLAVTGHRLAHDAKVLAAVEEESKRRLRSGAIMATSVVLEICADAGPTNKASDRLKAAEMLFNRVGMHAQSEHKVVVEHSVDDKTMIARITELARKQGLDPQKLLGNAALPVVEAEFTEVEDDELFTPLEG